MSSEPPLRLLCVLPTSPLPIFSGGRQRMYQILRRLAVRHHVTVLGFWRDEEARQGWAQLAAELAIDVIPIPFARLRPNRQLISLLGRRLAGRWRQLPSDVAVWDQPTMWAALRRVSAAQAFDIVQVEWPYLAPYALTHPPLPSLLITHDIFSVGLHRRAELLSGQARRHLEGEAEAWQRYEGEMYPQMGAVAAMSTADAGIIRQRAPNANVVVLPNGVDTSALKPGEIRPEARRLLFVGSPTHPPNLDAACWLLTEIWPRLLAQRPDLQLTLVNLDHPQVRASLQPGVTLTGRLADVAPAYRDADIALAPLRAGSGTRLKILEAFALGLPVVSTTIGMEGIDAISGQHLLIADAAPAFASAVIRLLDNQAQRSELAEQGRKLAEARYDWDGIVAQHDLLYRHLRRSSLPN